MRTGSGPRQLPLDFAHEPGRSRDDLVVTAANRHAVSLIDGWPDWPAPVSLLAGPAGSGKSHLVSIWREMSGASGRNAEAIGDPLSDTAFAIDDVDTGTLDQDGLFHLINHVRGCGGHILLTARRFPTAWGVTLPDLASRLRAATTVEIAEPDDELLAGVMAKLFADRQVEVEPHVIQFVVRRTERSLATAIAVVDRLDRAALEQKGRITRALAATVLNGTDAGQQSLDLGPPIR